MNTSRQAHIPALDGIRGLAILLVYLCHYLGGGQSTSPIMQGVMAIKKAGWIGVDLFFVLSGFLITGILLDYSSRPGRARLFYARRALRIFPVFYGAAIVLVLLTPLGIHWQAGHLAYLVYCQNFAVLFNGTLLNPAAHLALSHLWSLAVEEQFYLLWPIIIWSFPRRTALKLSIALVFAAPIIRWFVPLNVAYTVVRFDGFAMGGIAAICVREGINLRPWRWGLSGGLVLVGTMYLSGPQWDTRLNVGVGITAASLMFLGLLVSALLGGPVARALSSGWLRLLGRYSYGLYVYHFLLLGLFSLALPTSGLGKQVVWFAATAALNLAVAALSFHYFEMPFLRLKDVIGVGRGSGTIERPAFAGLPE